MNNIKYIVSVKIAILLFILSEQIIAQQIITDRPDQTEASSTIPKGSLQIESGLLIAFTEIYANKEKQLLVPTTLFRLGLTREIEIRILNQFENRSDITTGVRVSGISDMEVGTKVQILRKENVNTEIAFITHLIIPTGTGDVSNKKIGSINRLAVSHTITNNIGIGYNVGYNDFGYGKGELFYSLSLGVDMTRRLSVYIEPYGETIGLKKFLTNVDAGFTYLLRNNFQIDYSFGVGINYTMNYIAVGFSWNIN